MKPNDFHLQLYGTSPAPKRDYHGLTVTSSHLILNSWLISHGPHLYPRKYYIAVDELFHSDGGRWFRMEIEPVFGKHVVKYLEQLASETRNIFSLPECVLHHLINYLDVTDVITMGRTSKICYEIFNTNDIWKLIYGKYMKRLPTPLELTQAEKMTWRHLLYRHVFSKVQLKKVSDTFRKGVKNLQQKNKKTHEILRKSINTLADTPRSPPEDKFKVNKIPIKTYKTDQLVENPITEEKIPKVDPIKVKNKETLIKTTAEKKCLEKSTSKNHILQNKTNSVKETSSVSKNSIKTRNPIKETDPIVKNSSNTPKTMNSVKETVSIVKNSSRSNKTINSIKETVPIVKNSSNTNKTTNMIKEIASISVNLSNKTNLVKENSPISNSSINTNRIENLVKDIASININKTTNSVKEVNSISKSAVKMKTNPVKEITPISKSSMKLNTKTEMIKETAPISKSFVNLIKKTKDIPSRSISSVNLNKTNQVKKVIKDSKDRKDTKSTNLKSKSVVL